MAFHAPFKRFQPLSLICLNNLDALDFILRKSNPQTVFILHIEVQKSIPKVNRGIVKYHFFHPPEKGTPRVPLLSWILMPLATTIITVFIDCIAHFPPGVNNQNVMRKRKSFRRLRKY